MIYDLRTYTCRPGTVRAQLDLYAAHGLAAQTRHLGQPVLYGSTEVGDVNTYVHAWAYESMEDRARKRAAMQADPEWRAFLKLSQEHGYLLRQENTLLLQASFMEG